MTPKLVNAASPIGAWKQCVQLLAQDGDTFNLVVSISNPMADGDSDLSSFTPRKGVSRGRSPADVANTIFPKQSSAWDLPDDQFAAKYAAAYRSLLKRGPRSWGVYFLRLIEFGSGRVNQLERIVRGLGSWGKNHKAAFVVHFSSAETDAPRPLGAPCLQYCEFMREGGALSMLAVYRSHDYYHKALGNFVGLSRLLGYVAYRVNIPVGSLVCHSTYAYLGANRGRAVDMLESTAE